jgi:spore germination protein
MAHPFRAVVGVALVVMAAAAVLPGAACRGTASPGYACLGTVCLGYYTGDERSFEAVEAFAQYLTIVSADVYAVELDGTITGADDFGVVAFCNAHGIEVYACVSNYNSDSDVEDFDASLAYAAIVTHRDAVIAGLVEIAQDGGYDGVNVDFENLAYSSDIDDDRAALTAFIHELAARLHALALRLAISVPGKTEDSRGNDWAYPFDYAALGQDADLLQLMTYDQHGPWSEPGPVAGADWVEDCVAYAASVVDPTKLLLGLPAYGYDWDLTASEPEQEEYSATGFSWTDIPALLAKTGAAEQWDPDAQSLYVTYSEGGHRHTAWHENEASLRVKTAFVGTYGLAGLSVWSLGQEDASFWEAVAAAGTGAMSAVP